ncbi:MAG: hypothetical protein IIB61_06170 [Planctomycetes bacterium]|nr:hypothetical protein [Planctomycetota bacterium]
MFANSRSDASVDGCGFARHSRQGKRCPPLGIGVVGPEALTATDFKFNPTLGCENRDNENHRTPGRGPADKAIVLDGFTVLVNTTVANGRDEVGGFDVQGDGQFLIGFHCRLTLHAEDTSTVEGSILFRRSTDTDDGELDIDVDVTVNGANDTAIGFFNGVIHGSREDSHSIALRAKLWHRAGKSPRPGRES